MHGLTGADLQAVAEDVRDALRKSLKPPARAQLEGGAFELRPLIAAAAQLCVVIDARDGSRGWASALTVAAEAYALAMMAVEQAADAAHTDNRARGQAIVEHFKQQLRTGEDLPTSITDAEYLLAAQPSSPRLERAREALNRLDRNQKH